VKTRIKLEGEELENYWEVQKEKEKDKKMTEAANKSKETVAESDSDSEDEGIGLTFGGKARHDLMMSDEK
ncbi:Hypothetical predicted protein, partial [Paramuricea clavata]